MLALPRTRQIHRDCSHTKAASETVAGDDLSTQPASHETAHASSTVKERPGERSDKRPTKAQLWLTKPHRIDGQACSQPAVGITIPCSNLHASLHGWLALEEVRAGADDLLHAL